MASDSRFDEAKRQLEDALSRITAPDELPAAPETVVLAPGSASDRYSSVPAARVTVRRRGHAAPARSPRTGGTQKPEQSPTEVEAHPGAFERAPTPTSEALVRLLVGAALIGRDELAVRSGRWEATAGITGRMPSIAGEGEIGSGRFRYALIGWILETERQLRPSGSPITWLRSVVTYLFGTVFSVVLELLPLPRPFRSRGGTPAEPSDEDTRRWIALGRAEEARTRRYARAAIEEIVHDAVLYLARRPAVQQALAEIVRSPAMDDAVRHIVDGPVIGQAIERVAGDPGLDKMIERVAQSPAIDEVIKRVGASPVLDEVIATVAHSPALDQVIGKVAASPAIDEAVTRVVRTPAMEDAVRYLVSTSAMNDAIETLSKSPALVELVTTQSTSVANEILEEVRERAVSGDKLVEGIVRRILRRPPRTTLPSEKRGMLLIDVHHHLPDSKQAGERP